MSCLSRILAAGGNILPAPPVQRKKLIAPAWPIGFVFLFVTCGLLKIGSADSRNAVPQDLQYLEEPDRSHWQMPAGTMWPLASRHYTVAKKIDLQAIVSEYYANVCRFGFALPKIKTKLLISRRKLS
jgi:hypothetical protein